MTGHSAVFALLGGGAGFGLLLLATGLRPTDGRDRWRPTSRPALSAAKLRRTVVAATAAVLVLVVTRWVAAAAGSALLVLSWDRVFGGTRRARHNTARLEALAGWTESLRDLVASGIGLPEALPASIPSAAPTLHTPLQHLAERLAAREPLDAALRTLGDDLDDGGADLVVAALVLNSQAQGRALQAVLSALAASLREQVRVRRVIEAERRSTRRAVQIVVAVTVLTAFGLCVGNPAYVAPYRTSAGQLMLTVVVAVFGSGFAWLARLSALPNTPRLLARSGDAR